MSLKVRVAAYFPFSKPSQIWALIKWFYSVFSWLFISSKGKRNSAFGNKRALHQSCELKHYPETSGIKSDFVRYICKNVKLFLTPAFFFFIEHKESFPKKRLFDWLSFLSLPFFFFLQFLDHLYHHMPEGHSLFSNIRLCFPSWLRCETTGQRAISLNNSQL